MRVAVTCATGFLGGALAGSLEREGHAVVRVSRAAAGPGTVRWDPAAGTVDAAALEGLDAVVHLAAENVGRRWTPEVKRRIRESRERGTRFLAETLAALREPPRVLVSASAVGYYGAQRGDERLSEDSPPGDDFFGRLGQAWEAATGPAAGAGIRVVVPRFGMVLGRGGALERMLLPFRLGVGGRLGSGAHWVSWIALADAIDVVRFAIGTGGLHGPVNAVAPEPVTNAEFTRALGSVLHRPTPMVVPAAALHLMYGEMADATVLASQRVVPDRLLSAGFVFRFPRVEEALREALSS